MSNWIHTNGSYSLGNVTYGTYASNSISISETTQPPGRGKLIADEIILDGVDLESRLAKIEERLAILNTDPALEERWESLRDLGKKYKALEKVAIESETILKKLTGDEKI